MTNSRDHARTRALRAARVVTLGLAGAVATGCSASHTPPGEVDDAGSLPEDARVITADAGCPPVDFSIPPTNRVCCDEAGFWWDESSASCIIAVPGPFVPPAMV